MKTNNPYTPFDEQLREQLASLNPEVPEGVWEAMEPSLDALNQNLQFDAAIRESIEQINIPAPEGVLQAVQSQLGSGIIGSGLSIAGKWILGSVVAGVVATSAWWVTERNIPANNSEAPVVAESMDKRNAAEIPVPGNKEITEQSPSNYNENLNPRTGTEANAGNNGIPEIIPGYLEEAPQLPQIHEPSSQEHPAIPQGRPGVKLKAAPVVSFTATDTNLCAGQVYTLYVTNADACMYDVRINGMVVGQRKQGYEKFQYHLNGSGIYHVQCLIYMEDGLWKKSQVLHVNSLPQLKLNKWDLGGGRYAFEAGESNHTIWYLDGVKTADATIQLYDQQPKDHRITAHVTNQYGCMDSMSMEFRNNFVFDISEPVIPNVFTPDHDGVNDVFKINIEGTTHYKIKIYTMQGELVFESNDPQAVWDGKDKYRDNRIVPGLYTYIIEYALAGGEIKKLSNTITLIKE